MRSFFRPVRGNGAVMGAMMLSSLLVVFFALSFIRTVQEALWTNAVRNLIEKRRNRGPARWKGP